MEHQKHVVCVGQALVDCITRGMEEKPYKKNVYRADSISLNTGGDALNESIVLSHLGHQVSLVCAVGDDLAGHIVLHTARSNGVDVSHAAVSASITTPVANLMVQKREPAVRQQPCYPAGGIRAGRTCLSRGKGRIICQSVPGAVGQKRKYSSVDEGCQSRRRGHLCGYQNAHIQGDFQGGSPGNLVLHRLFLPE